jgi:hypothetical protein
MSSLSRQQQIIVAAMGVATVILLALLGCSVISGLSSLPETQDKKVQATGSSPLETPDLSTPLFPTWTPEPTSTPYVAPTAAPRPLSEESAATLDQVETDVIATRLLLPTTSVPRLSTSRRQLRSRYGSVFESEEWQEGLSSLVVALATLDLMSADTELTPILKEISVEQTASYYDPENEGIYILHDIDPTSPYGRVLYAHTYDHVLQDHNFGMDALALPVTELFQYADRPLAVTSLTEGESALLQEQYAELYFSDSDRFQAQQEALRRASSALDSAPRVIRELYQFPHISGKDFAQSLFDYNGWKAINDAYANPPASSEHILHPESYLYRDQPVPILVPSLANILGSEWHLAYDDTLGELVLRLNLENRLDNAEASVAAEGWGGDRCAVYKNDATGGTVMLLHTEWDTVADAVGFSGAYESYAEARFGHTVDDTEGGVACWEGSDVLCVAQTGNTVIVVLGPDRETVDKVLVVSLP